MSDWHTHEALPASELRFRLTTAVRQTPEPADCLTFEEGHASKARSAEQKGTDRDIKRIGSEPQESPRTAFLNGTEVGVVSVRGHSGSWAFGEFAASPQFAAFAPVFANWSSLMHAEAADGRLSATASEKLRSNTSLMHFAQPSCWKTPKSGITFGS